MRWQFWQNPAPRKLSNKVKKSLLDQFQVGSPQVDDMRLLDKGGRFAGRRVRFIRIFDPSLILGSTVGSLSYDQLERARDHGKSLLFEGHIETIDDLQQVFLSDRRTL